MDIKKIPPEFFLGLINDNKPFSLSRFGDGEVLCMSNHSVLSENCDGSRFLPEIVEPMKDIFRNNYNYYHCLLNCTFDESIKEDTDWFRDFLSETSPEMDFFDGEIWQDLSFSGRVGEIISAINKHTPVFIGGNHIRNIGNIKGLGSYIHILIPDKDSFVYFDWIKNQVLNEYKNGLRMFCFSAGFTTKIVIDQLFPVIGHDAFMIDFGSVFDPYCGILSRDTMVNLGIDFFKKHLLV